MLNFQFLQNLPHLESLMKFADVGSTEVFLEEEESPALYVSSDIDSSEDDALSRMFPGGVAPEITQLFQ
jgi:hypothetical protein